MAVHALVVGCDHYPQVPGGDLRGAVADALAVRDWLLSRVRVSPQNLNFLASPSAGGAQVEPGTPPATRAEFNRAVKALVARDDVGESDRLYVYFAGHGCRTDPLNEILSLDVIALEDFSPDDPGVATVGVEDLRGRLEQSRFGDVVLITDACRNLPFQRPFGAPRLGFDPPVPLGRPYTPRVYVAQATTPGGVAGGDVVAEGTTRGYFTQALIDGLTGRDAAKRYDETSPQPYLVTWSSLRAYVEDRLSGQHPRMRGDGELVMAQFPDGYFEDVNLEIDVDPDAERTSVDLEVLVTYSDPAQFDDGLRRLTAPVPQRVQVPPRRQRIRASTGDRRGQVWRDIYADARVVVPLSGEPFARRLPPSATVLRNGNDSDGAIEVSVADDPAAVVQVIGRGGQVALDGVGRVSGALPRADYTVTVTGIDGRPREFPTAVEKRHLSALDLRLGSEPGEDVSRPDPVSELLPTPHGAGRPSYLSAAGQVALEAYEQSMWWPLIGWSGVTMLAVLVRPDLEVVLDRPRLARLPDQTRGLELWSSPAGEPWAELGFGAADTVHRLAVPLLPGALTVVVAGENALQVSLFDLPARDHLTATLLYDRAQVLLGLTRPEQAAVIVRELDRWRPRRFPIPVLSALAAAGGQPLRDENASGRPAEDLMPEPLRRTTPADLRGSLVPGTPWAALLDFQGSWDRLMEWRAPRGPATGEGPLP